MEDDRFRRECAPPPPSRRGSAEEQQQVNGVVRDSPLEDLAQLNIYLQAGYSS